MHLKYNSEGVFNYIGNISDNFTLIKDQITVGDVAGNVALTLPTITDTEKQVVCIFDFTTINAGYPCISNTNLRWNNGTTPTAYSTVSDNRNILIFKSIWIGGALYWEAEYQTYGFKEVTFSQPTLSTNGTLGGSSFAVSADSYYPGRPTYLGFDNNAGTETELNATTGNFVIYNPNALKVSSINITNSCSGPASSITAYTVYGSNDNTNYTALSSGTNAVTGVSSSWSIPLSTCNFYKYIKLYVSATSGGSVAGFTQLTLNAVYLSQ